MTTNPIRKHLCRHCGHYGQGYVEYNNGFEFHCWLCSNVDVLAENEIPPELQALKHRYSVNVLQSSNVFQGSGRPKFNNREE